MRPLAVLMLLLASAALADPPTTCGQTDDYSRALCAYQLRDFSQAERLLRTIVLRGEKTPQTLRAHYFLARTLMKVGRFQEATEIFIRIYELDKPFYDGWSCDFLLGECRRAQGKG